MIKNIFIYAIFTLFLFAQEKSIQSNTQSKNIQLIQGKVGVNAASNRSLLGASDLKASVTTFIGESIDTDDYIKVSLIDVVLETVANSNNVKAAREKMRQAKIKYDDAYSGYLPSVDATYKNGRTRANPGDDEDKRKFYNDESYKLSVTQNLYAGGGTDAEIQSLDKKYEVAKNNYKLVIAKEIENAIKAYFDVLFNFQSLNVNIENMERLNEVLEIVNIKYETGATSIGDLSNIRANVSNSESKLITIQSKFNEALEYYKYIVGEAFVKTFPYEDDFDTKVDEFETILEKAIRNNENLENYKLNIEAEKFKLLNAKSAFKPKIDLELSSEKITDQEDWEFDEINNKAQIVFSYNFYNKGKDKNKILMINSMIRELDYRLKEEIRKLRWTLSKLHRSIVSMSNASVSINEEVRASIEMVNAYWDGFKLGEQDLQQLLQGQRQLNSAQLDLIQNKKNTITDYFKLLASTGELLRYFRLDIEADNFIDFTQSDYRNLLKTPTQELNELDLTLKSEAKIIETVIDNNTTDSNTTINDLNSSVVAVDENLTQSLETNTTMRLKDSMDDLLAFENKFLQTDEQKWTLRIFHFEKLYEAFDFGKEYNILKEMFVFDTLEKNKIKTNIAYNIFDTQELATQQMEDMNVTEYQTEVLKVQEVQKLHNEFKKKQLQTKVAVKKVKPFQTNPTFKNRFLNAPSDNYTINITSFSSIKEAKELLEKEKIYNDSFVFSYGEEKEWVKVMYGVFETYEEARVALEKLENIKTKYEPIIETINNKQELYKQYNAVEKNALIIKQEMIEEPIQQQQEEESLTVQQPLQTTLDNSFEEQFLKANGESYTINLATLFSKESAEQFFDEYGDIIDLIVFKFGQDKTYYKGMSGVFQTYEEAQEAIKNFHPSLQRNNPTIEKTKIKQALYHKYNTNPIVQENELNEQ